MRSFLEKPKAHLKYNLMNISINKLRKNLKLLPLKPEYFLCFCNIRFVAPSFNKFIKTKKTCKFIILVTINDTIKSVVIFTCSLQILFFCLEKLFNCKFIHWQMYLIGKSLIATELIAGKFDRKWTFFIWNYFISRIKLKDRTL